MIEKKGPPMVTAGARIQCPNCGDIIATVNYDLYFGDRIHAALFTPEPGQTISDGARAECSKCKELYLQGGKIFVEGRGWV